MLLLDAFGGTQEIHITGQPSADLKAISKYLSIQKCWRKSFCFKIEAGC